MVYNSSLPEGFVYLKEVNPTIIENLRYFSNENFTGKKVSGYNTNKVILTFEAAVKLAAAQQELLKENCSLVIYDAYRPTRATSFFVNWSKDLLDQEQKFKYYPSIDKQSLFKLGYIAEKSSHSRGSTVDITIIRGNTTLKSPSFSERVLMNCMDVIPFLDDNSIDMGSSFDLFNESASHNSRLVNPEYLTRRNRLKKLTQKYGFDDYNLGWWHYTLKNEPFPDTYFDFEIQ